jgi:hypothetical protein
MNHTKLKETKWKYLYKVELIIQSLDYDSEYWNYLYELKGRLQNKGFLFPSEYKKLDSWYVPEPYLKTGARK